MWHSISPLSRSATSPQGKKGDLSYGMDGLGRSRGVKWDPPPSLRATSRSGEALQRASHRSRAWVSPIWRVELKKHSPLERGDRGAVGEVPIQPLRTILNHPTHRASEPCLPLGETERSDGGAQCQRLRTQVSSNWRRELKKAFPSGGGFGARSFLFVECSYTEHCFARAIRRSRHGASPYRRTVCVSADCRGRKNTCAGVECGSKILKSSRLPFSCARVFIFLTGM